MRILDVSPRLACPPDNGSTARCSISSSSSATVTRCASSRSHSCTRWFDRTSSPTCGRRPTTGSTKPRPPRRGRPGTLKPHLDPAPVIFSGTGLGVPPARGSCASGCVGRRGAGRIPLAVRLLPPGRARVGDCLCLAKRGDPDPHVERARGPLPVQRSPTLRIARRLEQDAVERADLILAVSDDDRREYLSRYAVVPGRVVTVPNRTDADGLIPVDPEAKRALRARLRLADRCTVAYLALRTQDPGCRRVVVAPRRRHRNLNFLIVGAVTRAHAVDNVTATGFVANYRPICKRPTSRSTRSSTASGPRSRCSMDRGGGGHGRLPRGDPRHRAARGRARDRRGEARRLDLARDSSAPRRARPSPPTGRRRPSVRRRASQLEDDRAGLESVLIDFLNDRSPDRGA